MSYHKPVLIKIGLIQFSTISTKPSSHSRDLCIDSILLPVFMLSLIITNFFLQEIMVEINHGTLLVQQATLFSALTVTPWEISHLCIIIVSEYWRATMLLANCTSVRGVYCYSMMSGSSLAWRLWVLWASRRTWSWNITFMPHKLRLHRYISSSQNSCSSHFYNNEIQVTTLAVMVHESHDIVLTQCWLPLH